MLRLPTVPLLWLWFLPAVLHASPVLEFTLEGLDGELERNALAFIGAPPEDAQERLIFVVSIEQNIENSLKALGYYRPDVAVDVRRTEPVWRMAIRVDPGEPVHIRHVSLQVTGEAEEDTAFRELLQQQPFARDDALHHGTFEAFRRRLLSLGLQRGYFDGAMVRERVEVEPVGGTADIFLHYDSGPRYHFGALTYDREQIAGKQLRALLTFREGDHFDQLKLQAFQAQLQQTRFFSTVLARPLLEQREQGAVPIQLVLYPAERHSFDVGIGYSTDTEERVTLTWRTPRINRAGHSQETRLQYSQVIPGGRTTYTIPLSHPLNDLLQLSARLEENEYGDLKSQQEELGVRREFKTDGWVRSYSLRWLGESWEVLDANPDNNYLLPGLSFSRRDRVGPLVNPTGGFSRLYQLEAGSERVGSDLDLLRAVAKFRYVHTLAPRHRLVGRSDLGAVFISDSDRDQLAPSLSFFTGGSQSIRGFGYQSIGNEIVARRKDGSSRTLVVGGTRLAVASMEYQYSVTDQWRGALFIDGGDAFDEGEFDLNYGAGVGVHYVTQIGAIRLELANPVSEDDPSWRVHLAIGAEF